MSTTTPTRGPNKLPPPWFIHTAWHVHRALYRLSGGRFLWTTSNKRGWGALLLTTTGRKSGKQRNVIIGYIEDGPSLVTLAMNGGDEAHPAWWLNLESPRTPLFGWRANTPARCMHALPPARSVTGCGSAGLRSMSATTPSPDDGRSRLP